MAKIRPFKAVTYNPETIKDLSKVVCPPYDIISPARQLYYHDLNPYNFIHILLGKDIPGQDKYQRAAKYYNDWLKNKVLVSDEGPCIYFYSQEYHLKREKRTRLGFIALLSLEDKRSSIYTHEHTRAQPKEDRLKLLTAVNANLSPIFVLFPDAKRVIRRSYDRFVKDKKPFIDVIDDQKDTHKLWRIDDQPFLAKFQEDTREADIFIADGHHRYEVACTYKELMKQKLKNITGQEPFNYVLAYFTNVESQGLTILPIHRLACLSSKIDMPDFLLKLEEYFEIRQFSDKRRFFFLMDKAGIAEHVIGIYKDKKYWLLRLKNIKILDRLIPDKPKDYRSLDVSILNYVILNKILGLDLEDKENVAFYPDTDEVIERVDKDASCTAFFLNPVKIKQLMSVAQEGERMPSKSTYFYPKVLSGLVINPLTE